MLHQQIRKIQELQHRILVVQGNINFFFSEASLSFVRRRGLTLGVGPSEREREREGEHTATSPSLVPPLALFLALSLT
jgi:hypothetical protein